MIPTTDQASGRGSVVGIMESTRPIGSTGDSEAWMDGKANYVRIFGVFLDSVYWKGVVWGDAETIDPDCENYSRPKIIAELPEKVVTDKMMYETFADFLTKPAEDQGYVIEPGNKNSGQSLSYGVVGNAIRAVLWIARDAHYEKGTSDTKIFFQCLDSNSSSSQATWLKLHHFY